MVAMWKQIKIAAVLSSHERATFYWPTLYQYWYNKMQRNAHTLQLVVNDSDQG